MGASEEGLGRDKQWGYAAWIAVCILWGTGFLATRVGVRAAPPLLFAGLRILFAGLILTVWRAAAGDRLPGKGDWSSLLLTGIAMEGLCNGVLAWAAQWLTSGLLAILLALTPAWMVGLEAAVPGGERLSRRAAAGLAVCFGGLVWLLAPQIGSGSIDSRGAVGCLLLQFVCFSYAAGSIYTRRLRTNVKPLMAAGIQMVAAGGALCLVGWLTGETSTVALDSPTVLSFLYLLVFGSLVGYSAYVYALQTLPIATVSLHRYVNPVVALLLGWIVLGERLQPQVAAGIAVIALGIWLVQRLVPSVAAGCAER